MIKDWFYVVVRVFRLFSVFIPEKAVMQVPIFFTIFPAKSLVSRLRSNNCVDIFPAVFQGL